MRGKVTKQQGRIPIWVHEELQGMRLLQQNGKVIACIALLCTGENNETSGTTT